ncbi:MAG TPA: zinc ribbon domain-containing protein, partial [Dysgonamonadaceae bacterium]|nr:zinc ribbon domain-containing protein [Dysgonamonadaceae bacterium]
MSYCKNCGQGLSSIDKFCHSCGAKVFASLDKVYRKDYAQKMYKNTVQSLEKEGKSFIEKQVKQQIEKKIVPKPGNFAESTQQIQEVFKPPKPSTQTNTKPIESQSGINIWTWIYLAINAILIYLGYRNDD